jgi:hypothetical protein
MLRERVLAGVGCGVEPDELPWRQGRREGASIRVTGQSSGRTCTRSGAGGLAR